MPRLWVIVLLLLATLVAGLATLNGPVLALVLPLWVFIGAALYWRPPPLQLRVDRTLDHERVDQGTIVQATLTLQDPAGTVETIRIRQPLPDNLELENGDKDYLAVLPGTAPFILDYRLRGPRGYYVLPPVELEAHDPLGLLRTTTSVDVPNRLLVLPQALRIPSVAIKVRRTRVYPGMIPARKGGPGVEFYGLREYQTGDSWRWLNHRVNARLESELFVNEFELERAIDIGLILDVRAATNLFTQGHSILEHSVLAVATLAESLLTYGNRVGLFLYGGSIDWTFPGAGKQQYEKILRTLARARIESSQIFNRLDRIPVRLFPHRSLLILVSTLHPQDYRDLHTLRAKQYQVMVVSPDPIAFETALLEDETDRALAQRLAWLERNNLMAHLARRGIQVCNWDTRQSFADAAPKVFSYPGLQQALNLR